MTSKRNECLGALDVHVAVRHVARDTEQLIR